MGILGSKLFNMFFGSHNNKTDKMIYNKTEEVQKHDVAEAYRITSNDTQVPTIYKNNKYIFSSTNSLMAWSANENKVVVVDIERFINDPKPYLYMIHSPMHKHLPYSTKFKVNDTYLSITSKIGVLLGHLISIYTLNRDLAESYESILAKETEESPYRRSLNKGYDILYESDLTVQDLFDIFCVVDKGSIKLREKMMINTGMHFISGVIDGIYFQTSPYEKYITLPTHLRYSSFEFILDLMGSCYYTDNDTYYCKFPSELKTRSFMNIPITSNMFAERYMITEDGEIKLYNDLEENYRLYKSTKLPKHKPLLRKAEPNDKFEKLVEIGQIYLYPLTMFKFIKSEKSELYDFSMEAKDADNFYIPGGPLTKNSDGDLLNIFALNTKEANATAMKTFSPTAPGFWLKEVDGSIDNVISMDYLAGLYSITK